MLWFYLFARWYSHIGIYLAVVKCCIGTLYSGTESLWGDPYDPSSTRGSLSQSGAIVV